MTIRLARLLPASLALRQALLFTGLGLASFLTLAALLIAAAQASLRADMLHTVDTDIAGLVDVMTVGGISELRARVADRIALGPHDGAPPLYFVGRADGAKLAGNLSAMPGIDPDRSDAKTVRLDGHLAIVRATRLRGGVTLAVGRSLIPEERLGRRLWRTFAWSAALLVLAMLLIGRAIGDRLGRRVTALNRTFERFDLGDLAARAGEDNRADEISRLGSHVDLHLANIQSLLQAQRQISDNIAHELRTPLVHLDARLLRALDAAPAPEIAGQLEAARTDIRSVVSLFDGLLDIALAEAGHRDAALSTCVDLSEIAGDVAELYALSVEEAGITFTVDILPGVTLHGEGMQLARMIANLLDNALKYVPTGARLRLEVGPGPRLIVEDNGNGIPPEDQERVFERFRRSGPAGEGHGLGLALVRVIAARHGLHARVEDAGPGARFIIEKSA